MPGAKTYDVQIDDDAAFVGAPNPVATPTTATRRPTLRSGPRPTGACGASPRRSALAVLGAPVVPNGVERDQSPATRPPVAREHHRLTVEEVVLDWAPLRGASAYELQISPDQYFNAPIGGTS